MLSDFGIARAINAARGEQLTETGLAIGTPAYMSPEQAAGTVDARSDLYSLGCVLYEMLGGEPPFTGPTPQAVFARHATDPMPPLRTIRATVPEHIESALQRVLAKVPADRYKTAAQFAEALSAAHADVAPRAAGAGVAERSVAVLPFTNMSADAENEYFSDGMTEEIINALTQVPGLQVAARTSSFAFKGKNADMVEIGRLLRVTKILEGSVRQAGTRLRVTAQLINVADGYHLWSERYDREITDVFAIQDELTAAIVDALKVRLTEGQQGTPLVKRGTDELEAYHLYLRGRHFWEKRALPQAMKCFEQAIAKDSSYALPHAGLADAYCLLATYGLVNGQVAYAKAKDAAQRALEADSDLAEAHQSMFGIETLFEFNLASAESSIERAIALNPNLASARAYHAYLLGMQRRLADLEPEARRAVELDPLSTYIARFVAFAYFLAREHAKALEACETGLEVDPNDALLLSALGWTHEATGRLEEAIELLQRAAAALQGAPNILEGVGAAMAAAGRREEAREIASELRKRSSPAYLVRIHTHLGEIDEAIESLEAAFEERNPNRVFYVFWPGLEALRSDPRFRAILTKYGVEQYAPFA